MSGMNMELHKLDTIKRVFFYEQDFYVLSNFSAFEVEWSGFTFKTSEHLYHWMRFTISDDPDAQLVAKKVAQARSAHDAFKIAQEHKSSQAANWNDHKCGFMKRILRAKAEQHEYVRRKLLATGDRELIEDSWRDDFWGWGPNRDGKNMLGRIWMEIRAELSDKSA
jgi:N-glycosidase YbiA